MKTGMPITMFVTFPLRSLGEKYKDAAALPFVLVVADPDSSDTARRAIRDSWLASQHPVLDDAVVNQIKTLLVRATYCIDSSYPSYGSLDLLLTVPPMPRVCGLTGVSGSHYQRPHRRQRSVSPGWWLRRSTSTF